MSDTLASGNKFRTLNVIDDCNRKALAIEVATSIGAKRVIRTLEQLIDWRGKPVAIRVDNGPEFTSVDFTAWCRKGGYLYSVYPAGQANAERLY